MKKLQSWLLSINYIQPHQHKLTHTYTQTNMNLNGDLDSSKKRDGLFTVLGFTKQLKQLVNTSQRQIKCSNTISSCTTVSKSTFAILEIREKRVRQIHHCFRQKSLEAPPTRRPLLSFVGKAQYEKRQLVRDLL